MASYTNVNFASSSEDSDFDASQSVRKRPVDASLSKEYQYIPTVEEVQGWDKFKQNEHEVLSASEKQTGLIIKGAIFLKVVTSVIVFVGVVMGGVVSKGALFYIVAQTGPQRNISFCPTNPIITGVVVTNATVFSASYDDSTALAWIWALFIAFCVPEGLSFLRSLKTLLMKSVGRPKWHEFLCVLCLETLHVTGLALLFFGAFPGMDSVKAVMTMSCLGLAPALLRLLGGAAEAPFLADAEKSWARPLTVGLNVAAVAVQASGLVVFPATQAGSAHPFENAWALPLGLALASLGWWEAFVSPGGKFVVARYLNDLKRCMIEKQARYFIYFFISLWKMLWFFFMFMAFTVAFDVVPDIDALFHGISKSFDRSEYNITMHTPGEEAVIVFQDDSYTTNMPTDVVIIQVVCGWACYVFAKFAAKTRIQRLAFTIPLLLVVPVSLIGIGLMCDKRNDDPCAYNNLPPFTFFSCPEIGDGSLLGSDLGFFWFFWFLSHIWITMHIWFPRSQKLASTDQMFGTPYYAGLAIDQSIVFNRRADSGRIRFTLLDADERKSLASRQISEITDKDLEEARKKKKKKAAFETYEEDDDEYDEDEVTRVYGCATMWHESSEEICEMLKSIFRIDEDSSARQIARERLAIVDPDYYIWETHIFFDDAMEPDDDGTDFVVNQFVRLLISQVEEQGRKWYGRRNMQIPPPAKYATPYGGRLVWTLPGQTQIICHLKDKNKIRHKKRWSQCMYMYYFLGYQLADNPDLNEKQKDIRSQNTYLLALDGDVDFQPDAIIKLVDLMKRNPKIGASCGRIHPIGHGYMQWYQKFEYAIGHWLQKATEHVMGCVLCSPGCFSLFRGKAVMDDNVMRTYTTLATEPRHYVQYDQGEDRWLCTLLLQQGWRVEYSAASDSFTACPEGFKEFYNQRRRWMPSTIANIADLLSDYKRVIKNNDDISIFYIAYQVMMMVGTVLGPGSIYLMLVGAFAIAFGLSNWTAFVANLVPMTIFVIACLITKPDTQIVLAQILSILYALVMIAVLVGMIIQITEDGLLAPTTLSLFFITFVFILAAVLHPQEFWCLPMGIIYFITIPSMYLLLVIYSVFNLNVVSWGTREVPKKKTAEELAAEKKEAEEEAKKPPKKKTGIAGWFQKERYADFTMRTMMKDNKNSMKDKMDQMMKKLDRLESAMKHKGYKFSSSSSSSSDDDAKKFAAGSAADLGMAQEPPRAATVRRAPTIRFQEPARDDMVNPKWIEEECIGYGKRKYLPKNEVNFWNDMIAKYLKPLDKNKEQEKKVSDGLKELKNQMAFSFLMINCIWVVTIFLMQANKDLIFIVWPWGAKGPNMTYTDATLTLHLEYEYLELEPIGFVFMVFFAGVLLIQLIGMLLHRLMTLGHVVATTSIRKNANQLCGRKTKFDPDKLLDEQAVEMIKKWQSEYTPDMDNDGQVKNFDQAVTQTLDALSSGDIRRASQVSPSIKNNSNLARSETMSAIQRRRTIAQRRNSRRRPMSQRHQAAIPETVEPESPIIADPAPSSLMSRAAPASNPEDAIELAPREQRKPKKQHKSVERTDTFQDPEGLDERDI